MKNNLIRTSTFAILLFLISDFDCNSQVGINTTTPSKQLDVNVEGLPSDGINITNTGFNAQLLSEPAPGAGTMILNNSASNGNIALRFNNTDRMGFDKDGFTPSVNASDNTVTGALDIGRFDWHFRRVYSRGIHTNDTSIDGGLRINIGGGGGVVADYNFSDFAFYPVASEVKDLGRNTNFWNNFFFVSAFTPSDERLKRNIKSISHGSETLNKFKLYEYNYTFGDEQTLHYGFMAQELQKILPELVSVGDDEEKTLSINYIELIPIVIKSAQEQQQLIDKQGEDIKELKAQVLKLLNEKK